VRYATGLQAMPFNVMIVSVPCCRYCLTRGGKWWKYDRYEKDLILYLVSVEDEVALDRLEEDSFETRMNVRPDENSALIMNAMMALPEEHDGQADKAPRGEDHKKDKDPKAAKPKKEKDTKVKQAGASYSLLPCVLLRVAAGEGIEQG
jgi:hypothetical protein